MNKVDELVQTIRSHYKDLAGFHDDVLTARKYMLSGTIVETKGKYDFVVNIPGQGDMTCRSLIDTVDRRKFNIGTKVYMISVIDTEKNSMKILHMSAKADERLTLLKAAITLTSNDHPSVAKAETALSEPESSELEKLSPEARFYVSRCKRLAVQDRTEKTEAYGKIPSKDVRKVYEICSDYLPASTRSVVGDLISRPMNARTEQRVRILMSIQTACEKEHVSAEEFRRQMDENVYGMQEVKDTVCEIVTASALSGSDFGLRILLIGPKGVGKEAIANCIAVARGKPHAEIPYGCFSSLPDAGGCSSLYDGSKPGAFAEAFFEAGTTDMTLILSSVNTATGCKDKNGDPSQILQEMLEGKLCDQYLECPIDVSKTWMIGLATGEEDIPPQIMSGFDHVFYIDPLSETRGARMHITTEFLLPKLLREFRLDPDKTYISKQLLRYLLRELCYDQGMDRMEGYLRCLLLYMVSHGEEELTEEMIDRILHTDRILKKPSAIVCRNITFFDKNDRQIVRKYIEDAEYASGERKENAVRIVNGIADMFQNTVPLDHHFDYKKYMTVIDQTHSGLHEAKVAGARMISRQTETKGHSGKNVLFLGAPGVGKTTLLRSIAHAANDLPFGKISCNGVNESAYFKGNMQSFKGATFGRILTTLFTTGLHALILLDEIDKIASNDAMVALLDLLDEKQYFDNFAGVHIDVSSLIFCASANDISQVPQPLLDRFEIIELPGYSFDQKTTILREHMLPQTLAEYDNADITFTSEAQTLLVKYCKGAGARDLRTNLQKVIELVLLEHKDEKYTVDTDDLIRYLGPVPIERKMSTKLRPGLAHGLAVGGYGGFVTDILIVRSKQDKLTGMVEGSCKESVEVARTAASRICPSCEDAHYHVHFGIGMAGIRKDGSSAGVPLALSMLSLETNTPVDPYSAFTGELSPAGDVCAVGGIPAKIQAAIDALCRRVYIPRDNYVCLRQEDIAHFEEHLEVIPVESLEEVYHLAMLTPDRQAVS